MKISRTDFVAVGYQWVGFNPKQDGNCDIVPVASFQKNSRDTLQKSGEL
jgi:hypothetical protein